MPKGQYPLENRSRGKRVDVIHRFWGHVVKTDTCWLWTGAVFNAVQPRGLPYGQFQYDGRPVLAHRFAWFMAHGEWPVKRVAHLCDEPRCVNPDHLALMTDLENVQDMNRKHRHPLSGKLNEDQVREIRRRREEGETLLAIAKRFGVSQPLVSKITRRLVWAGVN
jgi:hypothetical protein